jgi:hypothetical protein
VAEITLPTSRFLWNCAFGRKGAIFLSSGARQTHWAAKKRNIAPPHSKACSFGIIDGMTLDKRTERDFNEKP